MRDNDLRGEVLEVFYNARTQTRHLEFKALLSHLTAQPFDVGRICDQLAEYRLIEWKPIYHMGNVMAGMGSISAQGVDVIEGTATPPISITLHDHSINVSGSTNVQVGNANSIVGNIDDHTIFAAIDESSASPEQKAEAKSLWSQLTNNAAFAAIVGAVATVVVSSAAH